MKPLLMALFVWATASPLHADAVLLQESFEGAVGSSVSGWNGWTGDPGVVICNTVIDQGNSVTWTGSNEWPVVHKSFSYSPDKREVYVLTATLNAPDATGAYAEVRLATSNRKNAEHVGAQLGYRGLIFQQNNSGDWPQIRIRQSAPTMDIRLVVADGSIACYWRNHGDSTWTLAGALKTRNGVAAYHTVTVYGGVVPDRSVGGGVDSIQLVIKPADSAQEPVLQSN